MWGWSWPQNKDMQRGKQTSKQTGKKGDGRWEDRVKKIEVGKMERA